MMEIPFAFMPKKWRKKKQEQNKSKEDKHNSVPPPLSKKELEERRSGIMQHPALELVADEKRRKKILFGDIGWPTEFDKFIVKEHKNTEIVVKSQIAWLARETSYICRHLQRWVEEKVVGDIAEWYKQVGLAFAYRLAPIVLPCKEVYNILGRRLPALRGDFEAGYEKMAAVAKQCDIERTKWFSALPVTPIKDFKAAAAEFHEVVVMIHSEAVIELDKLTKSASGTAGDEKNGGQSIDSQNKQEDIVELKPNVWGIGLNINALVRKIKHWIKNKKST